MGADMDLAHSIEPKRSRLRKKQCSCIRRPRAPQRGTGATEIGWPATPAPVDRPAPQRETSRVANGSKSSARAPHFCADYAAVSGKTPSHLSVVTHAALASRLAEWRRPAASRVSRGPCAPSCRACTRNPAVGRREWVRPASPGSMRRDVQRSMPPCRPASANRPGG
jgi:hypothetical protein